MKKQILLTAMLLITTTTACAQFNIKIGSGKTFRKDTIDQTVLMVQYEVDGCTDTLSEERFQETMMLEIGKKCSSSTVTQSMWATRYLLPTLPITPRKKR